MDEVDANSLLLELVAEPTKPFGENHNVLTLTQLNHARPFLQQEKVSRCNEVDIYT